MKKITFLLFGLLCIQQIFSQKIRFEYDDAGNQIQRTWCPNCRVSNNVQEVYKEVSELEEGDLQKFFPEDVISYYPNPVEEELFLKWDLVNENKVTKIDVFNLNGQIIKSYDKLENENSKVVNFLEYPKGVYFLNLYYTSGDQKTIKIIKD